MTQLLMIMISSSKLLLLQQGAQTSQFGIIHSRSTGYQVHKTSNSTGNTQCEIWSPGQTICQGTSYSEHYLQQPQDGGCLSSTADQWQSHLPMISPSITSSCCHCWLHGIPPNKIHMDPCWHLNSELAHAPSCPTNPPTSRSTMHHVIHPQQTPVTCIQVSSPPRLHTVPIMQVRHWGLLALPGMWSYWLTKIIRATQKATYCLISKTSIASQYSNHFLARSACHLQWHPISSDWSGATSAPTTSLSSANTLRLGPTLP